MISRDELRLLLPNGVRYLPADLVAVLVVTLCTVGVVFVPGLNETPLRVLFGLLFVFFVPGYVFIAALFPGAAGGPDEAVHESAVPPASTATADATDDVEGKGREAARSETDRENATASRAGISGIERVALSVGSSIAIVPLLGLVVHVTPWGIRLAPTMFMVGGVTLGMTAVAARRRAALPADERFSVPYRDWIETGRSDLLGPDTRFDVALNVLLAASLILAVGSVSYTVAAPPQGEQFSELYLVTEDDDGELVADGYPSELVADEPTTLVVGVGNQEHESTEYTVVVQLQAVELGGGNLTANESATASEIRVVDREQVDAFSIRLDHNETRHQEHELRPTISGETLRVQYLLYRGEPPSEPTEEDAYRSVHLWVADSTDQT